MKLFKMLFGWLKAPNRQNDPEHPDLHALDKDELLKELDIEAQARRLGAAGAPAPDETHLSGVEESICQKLESFRLSYQGWATTHVQRIQERLVTYDITKTVNRTANLADEFEREANRRVSDRETELRSLRSSAHQREQELLKFREKNQLTRHAQVISGTRKAICILLAIFTVAVEGILNAGFFAAGLDGGLFQGFFFAGALAAANVGIAFALGRLLVPNINHINSVRRLAGYLSVIVAGAIMVGLGLIIAHFRDALGQAGDVSITVIAATALRTLQSNPLGFHDVFSIVLCVFSVVFALAGLCEGYKLSDPYPGYAGVQRIADEAQAFYDDEIAQIREELEHLKEEYVARLEEGLEQARNDVVAFRAEVDKKRIAPERLQRALDRAEHMMSALVKIFRTENEISRKATGVSVPAYFRQPVPVRQLTFPDFSTAADELALQEQEELLTDLLAQIEDIRRRIQSSYDVKFSQLEPIRQQI